MITKNFINSIGKTPLFKINNITKNTSLNLFVKPEYLNPSGSIKDRVALNMIDKAEKEGKLKNKNIIIESSTGNTGIALSYVGMQKGYKVKIFEATPHKASIEKIKIMENLGAEVVLLESKNYPKFFDKGIAGAEIELEGRLLCLKLEQEKQQVWWARQFSNPSNILAHNQVGEEIIKQIDVKIDFFCAAIGTGGTLLGIAEILKERFPDIKVVGIIPKSSKEKLYPGMDYPDTEIKGGIISKLLKRKDIIDDIITVKNEDAINMTYRLWKEEGLFCGISSGANVFVALEQLSNLNKNLNAVTILPDHMDRYLLEERFVT